MANGILNISRYLETLQTITELGNTFPSSQTTLNFTVGGSGVDGWTATIQWKTLIIDSYYENLDGTPNFSQSQVFGYYEGGSANQYSTGTISLPENMYTGPMLPAATTNLPITVVNISWLKGQQTYDINLALIQNWEPGVTIGDPFGGIGFEPITPLSSTLQLTGPAYKIVGDTATFIAISDIPIDLGYPNPCFLYANDQLVATEYMVDHTATFNISLNTGTYTIYAKFGGIKQYSTVFSNTLSYQVIVGLPLLVQTRTLTPSKAVYYVGESLTQELQLIVDPAYTPTGQPITTTNSVSVINGFAPNLNTQVSTGAFVNGYSSATFTITAPMADSAVSGGSTTYAISTWTANATTYTATYVTTNTDQLTTFWDYQDNGPYASGSSATSIGISSTASVTRTINPFPLTISQSQEISAISTPITFTVTTIASAYGSDISVFAQEASSATVYTLYSDNHSGTSTFSFTTASFTIGTWTVYASYPGDLGQSIFYANAASTSSAITHFVTSGSNLGAVLTFSRTSTTDRIQVTANTTTNLTATDYVSFYNGSTFLGTASWFKGIVTTSSYKIYDAYIWKPAPPAIVLTGGLTETVPYFSYNVVNNGSPGVDRNTVSNIISTPNAGSLRGPGYVDELALNKAWEFSDLTNNIQQWYNPLGYAYYPNARLINYWGGVPVGPFYVNRYNSTSTLVGNRLANYDIQTKRRIFGGQGKVNPNRYRAWRYYDGSNYNLSSSTAFLDCLDPITTGSWTVTKIKNYEFNQPFPDLTWGVNTNVSFADNARIYKDGINDYGWDVYDVYRLDQIGDPRGYNVIGLTSATTYNVSTSTPLRLYFSANNAFNWRTGKQFHVYTQFYIDLVEFIGTITQKNCIIEDLVINPAPSTSTIYLYRFTPTVRAADNNSHRAIQPHSERVAKLPANTLQPSGRASRIAMTKDGIFKMPADAPIFPNLYVESYLQRGTGETNEEAEYGFNKWYSRNTSDPIENQYADFCNVWYATFINGLRGFNVRGPTAGESMWQNTARNDAIFITTSTYVESNTQTATLEFASGTIDISQIQRATWPGTLALDVEYGKFLPFDLTITTSTNTLLKELYKIGSTNYQGNTTTSFSTLKPGYLIGQIPQNLNVTGQLTFINSATGQSIYSGNIPANQRELAVITNTISTNSFTTTNNTSTVWIKSIFTETYSSQTISSDFVAFEFYKSPYTQFIPITVGNITSNVWWNYNNKRWTLNGTVNLQLQPLQEYLTGDYQIRYEFQTELRGLIRYRRYETNIYAYNPVLGSFTATLTTPNNPGNNIYVNTYNRGVVDNTLFYTGPFSPQPQFINHDLIFDRWEFQGFVNPTFLNTTYEGVLTSQSFEWQFLEVPKLFITVVAYPVRISDNLQGDPVIMNWVGTSTNLTLG